VSEFYPIGVFEAGVFRGGVFEAVVGHFHNYRGVVRV
jgi:hypothetical protein